MFSTIPSRIAKAFPAGSAPFSPADISDLVGWWDAGQGVNTTGSNVNSWDDLSNTIGDFNYNFGNKAVLYNNGFGPNNLPYIKGEVNGSAYTTASNWPSTSTSTFYIVYRPYQQVGGAYQGYMEQSNFGAGFIFLDAESAPRDGIQIGFTSSLVPSIFPTLNSVNIIRVKWNGSTNLIRLNDDYEVSTPSVLSSQPSNPLWLFNRANVNFGAGFDAAEIIIYNKVLNAGELTQIDNYLYTKYGLPPAPVYLFDAYPGALHGYSIRKLSSTYSGSSMRVRRSSDNAELDIGFVGENLDVTTLTTFCAGTDGYVKTWYDQSGNGNNATQTNSANQPQIVSGGVINTVSGIGTPSPAIRFFGSDDFFELPYVNNSVTQATTFGVYKTVSTGGGFWNYNNNNGGATHHPWTDNNAYEGFGSTSRYGFSSEGLFVNQHLYTLMSKTNDWQAFINGVSKYTSGSNTVYFPKSTDGVTPKLGSDWLGNSFFYNGFYQEHIFYPSDVLSSRTAIEGNINNYYSIY